MSTSFTVFTLVSGLTYFQVISFVSHLHTCVRFINFISLIQVYFYLMISMSLFNYDSTFHSFTSCFRSPFKPALYLWIWDHWQKWVELCADFSSIYKLISLFDCSKDIFTWPEIHSRSILSYQISIVSTYCFSHIHAAFKMLVSSFHTCYNKCKFSTTCRPIALKIQNF